MKKEDKEDSGNHLWICPSDRLVEGPFKHKGQVILICVFVLLCSKTIIICRKLRFLVGSYIWTELEIVSNVELMELTSW